MLVNQITDNILFYQIDIKLISKLIVKIIRTHIKSTKTKTQIQYQINLM